MAQGAVTPEHIAHLHPKTLVEKDRHAAIASAIAALGAEKLKPIYEHLNGVYSYDDIKLVRALALIINKQEV